MPVYVPGKPAPVGPGGRSFKLSSNEMPFPPHPDVLAAATSALERLGTYPDAGAVELTQALAGLAGGRPAEIAVGHGSVALLFQIVQAYAGRGDEVVHAWRSFEAYPLAVSAAGATGVPVPLDAGGRHDLAAMADAVTDRTTVVLLCSPNNPTGPALGHSEVVDFLDRVDERVLVVLDEAYREFVRSSDPLDGAALALARPNVVALRTLSKAWGLAGMRVGYAVGAERLVAPVRAVGVPFALGTHAQAAALAALSLPEVMTERVAAVVSERERLVARLAHTDWAPPEAQGNFVWLPMGSLGEAFVAAAAEQGVALRGFSEGVRVTVGQREANDLVADMVESGIM